MTPATRRAALESVIAAQAAERVNPPLLLPADPYFDLAGEEFGRRLLLTSGNDGAEYCLRPDFTLPIVADYIRNGVGEPAAFSYLGPIFRQREEGPAEFDQAGLELIAQPDADAALDAVFAFARDTLAVYGVESPRVRLGGVGLFEALLGQADMPDAWRPRIRHRFGHPQALSRLLARLAAAPDLPRVRQPSKKALVEDITERMAAAGLSLTGGRTPEEIAERYLEQQALDAAHVPGETLRLLNDYLAISGPPLQALTRIEALAHARRLDLAAPLATLRRHLAALSVEADVVFEADFSPRLDYNIGATASLFVVLGVLALGIIASVMFPGRKEA